MKSRKRNFLGTKNINSIEEEFLPLKNWENIYYFENELTHFPWMDSYPFVLYLY